MNLRVWQGLLALNCPKAHQHGRKRVPQFSDVLSQGIKHSQTVADLTCVPPWDVIRLPRIAVQGHVEALCLSFWICFTRPLHLINCRIIYCLVICYACFLSDCPYWGRKDGIQSKSVAGMGCVLFRKNNMLKNMCTYLATYSIYLTHAWIDYVRDHSGLSTPSFHTVVFCHANCGRPSVRGVYTE